MAAKGHNLLATVSNIGKKGHLSKASICISHTLKRGTNVRWKRALLRRENALITRVGGGDTCTYQKGEGQKGKRDACHNSKRGTYQSCSSACPLLHIVHTRFALIYVTVGSISKKKKKKSITRCAIIIIHLSYDLI